MHLFTIIFLCLFLTISTGIAQTITVATFNANLTRSGPGLLLRDLQKENNDQISAVIDIIAKVQPDIVLINEIDHDANHAALRVLQKQLLKGGVSLPYIFAPPQNTGVPSGKDLNENMIFDEPQDAYGYGAFPGQYAMALLSRFPIDYDQAKDFRTVLWTELPWARMPTKPDGSPFLSESSRASFRFSSKSHWDVPVNINGKWLHILASHPTPPVFDGAENLNGLRNATEIGFWTHYLEGDQNWRLEGDYFVILGSLNADPLAGEGDAQALSALLNHAKAQHITPKSTELVHCFRSETPARDRSITAKWLIDNSCGLRVDYIIPARALTLQSTGLSWPAPVADKRQKLDHALVWAEISFPE